ncbi:amino acid ABC transporter substrate-binding protein [Oleomonas cavernae]|uniref:Amino acid ABC transporter substrate-binding protein n=1 Tax=Oleomonas cavernae TaxID=2320859 RepID=A0A418WG68_9PROT|nr:amino acid ABC transporter substrate-binding protein [Oleomonas cavernae]
MTFFAPAKLLLSPIFLLVTALAFAGLAKAQDSSAAIERIRQKGVLTVAMFAEDVPPFFYKDQGGRLVGIDPGLAEDIASKLGVQLVFNRSATTFDGVVDEVEAGRADIAVSLLSDTLDRARRVNFSRSYVSVRQFLLINRLELGKLIAKNGGGRADATAIPAMLNDQASSIGVIGGTSYVGFLKEDFPKARTVEFETWDAMLAAVKAGQLVALMYDEIEIGNWRLADPAGSLELRPFHLAGHPDTIAIAMNRNDPDLKAWIDLYLQKVEGNGFLASILNTYLYSTDRVLTND